jgi:hypothetical protein
VGKTAGGAPLTEQNRVSSTWCNNPQVLHQRQKGEQAPGNTFTKEVTPCLAQAAAAAAQHLLAVERDHSRWCTDGLVGDVWARLSQYHLTVNKQCQMVISLMQRDSRIAFGQRLPKHERHLLIGLTVLKVCQCSYSDSVQI